MINPKIPVAVQIEEAVKEVPGWSPLDQLLSLFTIAFTSANIEGDILELGSWCGRSAIALAAAASLTGKSRVHCVDLFPEKRDWHRNDDGTYSFSVSVNGRTIGAYKEQTVWEEPYLRDIEPVYRRFSGTRQAFESFLSINNLINWVNVFKGDLLHFSETVENGLSLRMAFIDGDHSFSAVMRDISIIEQYLLPGGWLCFDDAFSAYDGVDQAIQRKVVESGNYQCFQQITRKLFVAQRCF